MWTYIPNASYPSVRASGSSTLRSASAFCKMSEPERVLETPAGSCHKQP